MAKPAKYLPAEAVNVMPAGLASVLAKKAQDMSFQILFFIDF